MTFVYCADAGLHPLYVYILYGFKLKYIEFIMQELSITQKTKYYTKHRKIMVCYAPLYL